MFVNYRQAFLLTAILVSSVTLAVQQPADETAPRAPSWLHGVVSSDSAYLGVRLEEEIAYDEGGARVTSVVPGSPASEAGLQVDDIIVEFEGGVIRGPAALSQRIDAREPGDTVNLRIVRSGKKRSLKVELGQRQSVAFAPFVATGDFKFFEGYEVPHVETELLERALATAAGRLKAVMAPDVSFVYPDGDYGLQGFLTTRSRPTLGIQLVETTADLRRHLGGDEDSGVLVSRVLRGTPADSAGIEVGDLILSIDGQEVANARELRHALVELAGQSFGIEAVRDGDSISLEVVLPEVDPDADGPQAKVFKQGYSQSS